MKYRNTCHDCGCSCECEHDCKGDHENCTSTNSKAKACNHHCGCFIGPLTAEFDTTALKTTVKA